MPGSTPTLRDMVQGALDRGQTLEQLESKAIDPRTGKRASKSLLSRIKRNELDRTPSDFHLRAIAVALGTPYDAVRRAAINQWLPAEEEGSGEEELLAELRRMREAAERMEKQIDAMGERDAGAASA
jgi:hypothetical protein